MTTQSQRKSSPKKTEQMISKEDNLKPSGEVVVLPAEDYKKLIESLSNFMKDETDSNKKGETRKIDSSESIQVISLSPGIVNAVTSGGDNNGRVYRFRGFGISMEIPYGDLVNIVQNHFKLFEDGYLYVNDARFTRVHGLEQVTKRVLTKEQMEKIVYGDYSTDLHLFENATSVQKEHMVAMLMDDINAGKEVDMNRIYSISKFVGYDISDRAHQFKQAIEGLE